MWVSWLPRGENITTPHNRCFINSLHNNYGWVLPSESTAVTSIAIFIYLYHIFITVFITGFTRRNNIGWGFHFDYYGQSLSLCWLQAQITQQDTHTHTHTKKKKKRCECEMSPNCEWQAGCLPVCLWAPSLPRQRQKIISDERTTSSNS